MNEEAVSRAQQKFFGMVRARQKGEMQNASPEVEKAAASMKKSDVKKFASTKHKGLPEKKEVKEDKKPEGEERFCELCGKMEYREECSYGPKMWDMFTIKNFSKSVVVPAKATYEETDHSNWRQEFKEEGLRDWFGKSSGTTKSGRKVRGWVQVGGKYDGKPCARQPGQKSTPKCVSSSKRRSMSKSERDSAARRKRAADPNQPQKSGAAKPTNVSTDPKKKMSENYFNEAKDKKGKGSGTKDACYHKVKSRYSVWPSAYASGALVKCRKVGAANWGNKSKNEGFSPMQVAALEAAGMIEIKEGKKCWKGYKKAGTQKLFGKTYNRCVKAGDELNHDGEQLQEMNPSFDINPKKHQSKAQKIEARTKSDNPNEAAVAKKN